MVAALVGLDKTEFQTIWSRTDMGRFDRGKSRSRQHQQRLSCDNCDIRARAVVLLSDSQKS